jgi:hypothetical protein
LTASVGQVGAMQDKIGNLDLLSFSKGDQEMVMEAMTFLQNALNEVFNRVAQ